MRKKIRIPEPCDEDWNEMTFTGKGKFCAKCEKEVFDFTGYHKDDILKVLKDRNKFCGMIDKSQLRDRNLITKGHHAHFSKFALFIGLGTMLGISQPAISRPVGHRTEITENKNWKGNLPERQSKDSLTMKGVVLDSGKLPLPGVIVHFLGNETGVQTNLKGEFSIDIPVNELGEKNILRFSFIGFETLDYRFYPKNRHLKIQLKEDTTPLIGEVIIVREQNIFQRIGSFFHRLFSKHHSCG